MGRPRKTARRKNRRAPVSASLESIPDEIVDLEYCERHKVEIPAGDPRHRMCPRRALLGDDSADDSTPGRSIELGDARDMDLPRFQTGWAGFDRVTGGGLVINSITLVGGPPAIGKSTLLLQIAGVLSATRRVLIVSGEEIEQQIGDRAKRLGVDHLPVYVLHTKNYDTLRKEIRRRNPDVVVVDSAQVFADTSGQTPGAAGTVTQVNAIGQNLTAIAKAENRVVLLVCQETKDGDLAGPKQLEHLVDTVLRFDKDTADRRFLMSTKNRFGPAFETAVYDMGRAGLVEIGDVTLDILEERLGQVGVVPFAAAHLAQPVLLAVEASVLPIDSDDAVNTKKIDAEGYPLTRLRRLLERMRTDIEPFADKGFALRVEVPKVLGSEVEDEELDLAVAAALLSALRVRPPPRALFFGKIGFSGAVTSIQRAEKRMEAARDSRLGLSRAIVPSRVVVPDGVEGTIVKTLSGLETAMWPPEKPG